MPVLSYGLLEPTDRRRKFFDRGILGDKTYVTVTRGEGGAEPKVEGGPPYQIFLSPVRDGDLIANRRDLEVIVDEVRRIIGEIGDIAKQVA
jgi:hypothetical protein